MDHHFTTKKTIPPAINRISRISTTKNMYFFLAFFCSVWASSMLLFVSTKLRFVLRSYSEITSKFCPCSSTIIPISFMISLIRTVVVYT